MPKKKLGKSPMETALDYLALKPRTVREMELHLDQMEYGEYEVYSVVERLKELGYLDDAKYAENFVASRLAAKAVSKRKLYEQLVSHHLTRELIEEALREVPEETEQENAMEVAKKFDRQFSELPDRERKERVYRRLAARGYSYETIRSCLTELFDEAITED